MQVTAFGYPLIQLASTNLPMQIAGFEILEHLGQSVVTDVWLAYQQSLKREVILKMVRPEFASNDSERERFIDEAKTTAQLRHPGIVQIFDVNVHDGLPFLVMEHVPGNTLAQVVEASGRLDPAYALTISTQIAEALRYAWDQHRLIHRNLTPKSILLGEGGEAKLAYMGISLRVDPLHPNVLLQHGMIEGTPHYMAPEQATGCSTQDCRTDMYSLGAVLYHLVTGHIPFNHCDPVDILQMQVNGFLRHPQDIARSVPHALAHLIRTLMMKNPAHRFASWDMALKAMKRKRNAPIIFVSKRGQLVSTISPRNKHRSQRSRYRITTRRARQADKH